MKPKVGQKVELRNPACALGLEPWRCYVLGRDVPNPAADRRKNDWKAAPVF